MTNMSLEKRVYICFVILILVLASGCHSVRYDWMPNRNGDDPDVNRVALAERAELGGIDVDVFKIYFIREKQKMA